MIETRPLPVRSSSGKRLTPCLKRIQASTLSKIKQATGLREAGVGSGPSHPQRPVPANPRRTRRPCSSGRARALNAAESWWKGFQSLGLLYQLKRAFDCGWRPKSRPFFLDLLATWNRTGHGVTTPSTRRLLDGVAMPVPHRQGRPTQLSSFDPEGSFSDPRASSAHCTPV